MIVLTRRGVFMSALATTVVGAAMFMAMHKAALSEQARERVKENGPALKTLTIAQTADADTLDPSDIDSTDTLNIARLLFATLYRVSPDGKLQPYLAESYQYAEDGKSITLKIRPGMKCESGSPLTAKDVAYSFDRAANPALKFTGNSTGFVLPSLGYEGSRVDDELTVTLLVKKYNPIAIGLLSEMLILCKAPYERMTKDQAATHPSATGPYRLAEWVHDDRIALERNPNYSLPKPPYDRVVWRIMPEGSTRAAELIAGNVDIITNVAPDQIDAINSSDTAKVETVASTRRMYVGFSQNEKFSGTPGGRAIRDPAVRLAMQYAVDVPAICESLLRTPCTRLATMILPSEDHSGIAPFPYDPDRAERMLDAAGYPRGKDGVRFDLTLQAPRGRYLEDADVAMAVGQYFSDIGVRTDVEVLDYSSVFVPLTRKHELGPLFLLGTGGALWSPLYDLSDLSEITSGTNYTDWTDPEFFGSWKALEKTRDPAEQNAIVNQMMQIFHARGPWLPLYCQPDIYGVSNKIVWKPRADEVISVD
jgi:peptide/nickel transport system substrate-binding protein